MVSFMKEFRIEELAEVVSGGTPSTKNSAYWDGEILWVTPKDLSNSSKKWICSSISTITTEGLKNSAARMLPANSVLLSSRAPIGYLALAGKPLCTNQGFKSMICNKDIILPEYLYYYLQTKVEELNNISTGSTFKELSASLLKSYTITIHEFALQQHIVDILGSIDEKIENNEQEIRKINDLALCFIAKSNNLNTELKPYIKFIKGKKPIENGRTTAPYLSIDAITSFRYESVYSDDMIMATPFDILMVMDGASSGTVFSHQAGVVSSTIAKIDCSDNIKDYLYWYLLSLKEIIKSRNTGSAIPHANKEYILSLKFDYGFATDIKTINILHSLRTKIIQLQEENKKLQKLKGLYLKKLYE